MKLLFVLLLCCVSVRSAYDVHVGVVMNKGAHDLGTLNFRYQLVAPALDIAMRFAEEQYGIRFVRHDFPHNGSCNPTEALGLVTDLYFRSNVSAFIGPGCSDEVEVVSKFAAYHSVPMVTGVGDLVLTRHIAETLTRLSYSIESQNVFVETVLYYFHWHNVAIIYESSSALHRVQGSTLFDALRKAQNISTYFFVDFDIRTFYDRVELLQLSSLHARIIFIFTTNNEVRNFMLDAHKLGMTKGDYSFFTIELFFADVLGQNLGPWQKFPDDGNNAAAKAAYECLFVITLLGPLQTNRAVFDLRTQIVDVAKTNYGYDIDEKLSYFVTAYYDAVIYLALAYNRTLEDGEDPKDGLKVAQKLWESTYPSFLGDVYIDPYGDRIAGYVLLDMTDVASGIYTDVIKQEIAEYTADNLYRHVISGEVAWAGGKGPTIDVPLCGFRGEAPICQPKDYTALIAGSVSASILIIILTFVAAIFAYRKVKYEWRLARAMWEIEWEDIIHKQGQDFLSTTSLTDSNTGPVSHVRTTKSAITEGSLPMFTTVGLYHGTQVAIRKFHSLHDTVELNRTRQHELKLRVATQHENLVRFIGACIHENTFCTLVVYCPKGSLEDILSNDVIKLDWTFKYSLINDIVRGMNFLHHSDIGVHGRLQSTNCVVNSKLVLEIMDFGLQRFYEEDDICKFEMGSDHEYQLNKKMLWRAPERVRRDTKALTQSGDVYSFAIILHEIITRESPYETWELEPADVLKRVKAAENPPFRPIVNDQMAKPDLINLLKMCWTEDELARPTFKTVHHKLKNITKGNRIKGTLVDNQLRRMEQYAENLEALVEARTKEFLEEKQQAEDMLYRVLPDSIANRLKEGETVPAEVFECATVLFASLIDFPFIAGRSSPAQMVDFLNDLHNVLDDTIGRYDVHKMELSNDAFMVVSGIPTPSHNIHAREIAFMSLAVIDATQRFLIRHLPAHKLTTRIGIHSGPCGMGLIGILMPQFCVFGKTVHIAAELEKTGRGSKIQLSEATNNILNEVGGFVVTLRGRKEMLGVGSMLTYWLDEAEVDSMKGASEEEVEIRKEDYFDSRFSSQVTTQTHTRAGDVSNDLGHLSSFPAEQTPSEMVVEEMAKLQTHPKQRKDTDEAGQKFKQKMHSKDSVLASKLPDLKVSRQQRGCTEENPELLLLPEPGLPKTCGIDTSTPYTPMHVSTANGKQQPTLDSKLLGKAAQATDKEYQERKSKSVKSPKSVKAASDITDEELQLLESK